jgi:hypothetical protein
VDDEIEGATVKCRRSLHVELDEHGFTGTPGSRETGRVLDSIVDHDELRAARTDLASERLSFRTCPEDGHAPPGKRRDASDERHAATVHTRSQASVRSGTRQGARHPG